MPTTVGTATGANEDPCIAARLIHAVTVRVQPNYAHQTQDIEIHMSDALMELIAAALARALGGADYSSRLAHRLVRPLREVGGRYGLHLGGRLRIAQ